GYSTDADTLESLSGESEIVAKILEYRTLSKLLSTYVVGLSKAKSEKDGRIHTTFQQFVTATGRISSVEPNLQNIPVRTAYGREIRKAFVASPGNVLLDADYSQIELRLLAHVSGDSGLIAAFQSGQDIHAQTASEVFHVPLSEVTAEQRGAAKAVNFGIVYGISDFGLAKNLGISRKQAGRYIAGYLEHYPQVAQYMKDSVAQAREKGCALTLFNRRRPLPEIASSNFNVRSFGERVAMNMPIQGSAADIIKLAMIAVHRELARGGFAARLILQVHDELIVDAPEAEAEAVAKLMTDCMCGVAQLAVPLHAEVKMGKSWYDTK
ncbi:MAG: DNA polymerase, partial [Clostridiales bacterium]|nr:DNA polymerase [Clostridiales bacterium]